VVRDSPSVWPHAFPYRAPVGGLASWLSSPLLGATPNDKDLEGVSNLRRDPFWLPLQATEQTRDRYWKMLGKYARSKTASVLVGVKY
jgi:hypothetical protein